MVGVDQSVVQCNGPFGELACPLEALPVRTPQELPALQMRPAQPRVGRRVLWVQVEGFHEESACLRIALSRRTLPLFMSAKHTIVGLQDARRCPAEAPL